MLPLLPQHKYAALIDEVLQALIRPQQYLGACIDADTLCRTQHVIVVWPPASKPSAWCRRRDLAPCLQLAQGYKTTVHRVRGNASNAAGNEDGQDGHMLRCLQCVVRTAIRSLSDSTYVTYGLITSQSKLHVTCLSMHTQ